MDSGTAIFQAGVQLQNYFNLDKRDVKPVLVKLLDPSSQSQHYYPPSRPQEDVQAVLATMNDHNGNSFLNYYQELQDKNISELDSAVNLLAKILTDRREVGTFLEGRTTIMRKRFETSKSYNPPRLRENPPPLSHAISDTKLSSRNVQAMVRRVTLSDSPSPQPTIDYKDISKQITENTAQTKSKKHKEKTDEGKLNLYQPDWMKTRIHLTQNYVMPSRDIVNIITPPSLQDIDVYSQEYLILEDVISLLMGVQGWYVTFHPEPNNNKRIVYQEQAQINPSLKSLIHKLEPLFICYSNVTQFIEEYSNYDKGMVSQALCSVMSSLLKEHYSVAAQLETQLRIRKLSLQQLWFYLQPCIKSLSLLNEICTEVGKNKLKGASILTVLHKKSSFIGDPKVQQWCLSIVENTCVPYFEMLENWIYRGMILDPCKEFMIEESSRHSAIANSMYYWETNYVHNKDNTPNFLEHLSDKILRTGKYLNVFRDCKKKDLYPDPAKIKYFQNSRNYTALIDQAFVFSSKNLLETLLSEEHDLIGRLKALKRYFLMCQGDFFLNFMEMARDELSKKASEIQHSRLQSLLDLAHRSSAAKHEKYAEDLKIRLENHDVIHLLNYILKINQKIPDLRYTKIDGSSFIPKPGDVQTEMDLSGLEAFNLDFEVRWPVSLVISDNVMNYYELLFRQLFYLKHVESCLCAVWLRYKNVKQLDIMGHAQAYSRALILRQRMLGFVRNFQNYMIFEVITPYWNVFQKKIEEAKTVDDVMQSHMEFLEKCIKDCLMTRYDVMTDIWKILAQCILFRNHLFKMSPNFDMYRKSKFVVKASKSELETLRRSTTQNALKAITEKSFEDFVNNSEEKFNKHFNNFTERLTISNRETDPDHKTTSLLLLLDFKSGENKALKD